MMHTLDQQMGQWSPKLCDDLGIDPSTVRVLATTIADEIAHLPDSAKATLLESTPIPLKLRVEEIIAFQRWMDLVNRQRHCPPELIRAQVITQNYMCFVYLGEAWFTVLRKLMPSGTATRKLCTFLTENPVRAFRNAHGNWRYSEDFGGLTYWARKGSEPDEPTIEWRVTQVDLDFWQTVARCTAYASFVALAAPG